MKKQKRALWTQSVFWGLFLIGVALVLLLDNAQILVIGPQIGLWQILLGVALLAIIIERLVRGKIPQIFFPLACLFFLFEKPLAKLAGKPAPDYDLLNNWIVVLAALLLTVGTAILIPRRSKDGAVTKGHLGNTTLYLDARELQEYNINDRLGRTLVYFTNKEGYSGTGVITITNNIGQILLYVPKEWSVVTTEGNNIGRVKIPPQETETEKSITLSVSENLGEINVVFC